MDQNSVDEVDETVRQKPGRKAGVPPKTTQIHNLPDGPADNEGLTPRQRKILEFIRESVERRGFPPPSARSATRWGSPAPAA